MSAVPRTAVCDRMRAQVSLRLDGELSQLETKMLESHLERCADCREYDLDVTRITAELRAAPLERMNTPVVIRRARRLSALRLQAGVAAAMAVAVLGATTQLLGQSTEPAFATPERYPTSSQLTREVDQIIADGDAFGQAGTSFPL